MAKCRQGGPAVSRTLSTACPGRPGFYDLRLAETREQQAAMARSYGIHGFCYYHYWFNGRRLLERPFEEVLASGKPDFPFCLCWANDPWSRRWDGREDELLQAQTYSDDDDLRHIEALIPALSDPVQSQSKASRCFSSTEASICRTPPGPPASGGRGFVMPACREFTLSPWKLRGTLGGTRQPPVSTPRFCFSRSSGA